jgi:uncharacterized protein (TIGR03086 family)
VNVRALDRRAVLASIDVVSAVTPADLDRPTPCTGWDLRALLVHLVREHRGFAAAARGTTDDLSVWADQPLGDDPAGAYREAALDVVDAFSTGTTTTFWLPLITSQQWVEADRAVSFHLLDYVVHTWDVAATLGVAYDPDDELAEATLAVARAEVPDGPHRRRPDASFAPALPPADDEPAWPLALRMLGRDPSWSAPG